jgi:hypothetical protein
MTPRDARRRAFAFTPTITTPGDALAKALDLARWGCACFPLAQNGRPMAGSHGSKDGTTDADALRDLWRRFPGPLVGIATGEPSGFDVLDIDADRIEAAAWWRAHEADIPTTRANRTRSGGAHLHFRHAPGLRNSAGRIAPHIDVRASGGFIVAWHAHGAPIIEPGPPADWPAWLLDLARPKPSPPPRIVTPSPALTAARVRGILRTLADAPEGTRNACAYWANKRLAEMVAAGRIPRADAFAALVRAAMESGLDEAEAMTAARDLDPDPGAP